eukprot:Nk52_evm14s162 gene=Nk52_evmTU14s162
MLAFVAPASARLSPGSCQGRCLSGAGELQFDSSSRMLRRDLEKWSVLKIDSRGVVKLRKPFIDPVTVRVLSRKIYKELKSFAVDMFVGFKKLFVNTAEAWRYRNVDEKRLHRRQKKLVLQNQADLKTLVPFSIYMMIPMSVAMLPFVIKVYPQLLPSTFNNMEIVMAQRKVALEKKYALAPKVLKTAAIYADLLSSRDNATLKVLGKKMKTKTWYSKVYIPAHFEVLPEDILEFSSCLSDPHVFEFSNLPYMSKKVLVRYLGLSSFWGLEEKFKAVMEHIRHDDKLIQEKGVNTLREDELIEACMERGLDFANSTDMMTRHLRRWLQLSCHEQIQVPHTLMVIYAAHVLYKHSSTEIM